ncbi:MAG: radical SAM/SPASM domain protein, ACGX system [Ruthenibacterium lactatiformans]
MKEYFAFQWHITDECDQRCKHCYIFSENNCKHLDAMTWEPMQETFYNCMDFCKVHGRLPYFYITGGDPILHPDFWRLLALLKEHDIPFAILGNPFHLTDEVCMRLKGYGCRKYQLSLDGMRETHDWFRKPGSFDCTLEKIGCINRAGIRSVVMTTVSGANISEVPDIIDTVVKAGADVYAFARYCPTSGEKDTGMTPQDYRRLLDICYQKYRKYEAEGCKTCFNKKDHLWTLYEYEKGSFKIPKDAQDGMIYGGCNCGNCHMTILPTGDIMPAAGSRTARWEMFFGPDRKRDLPDGGLSGLQQIRKVRKMRTVALLPRLPAVASGKDGNFMRLTRNAGKSGMEFFDLVKRRRSIRKYQDRQIERGDLENHSGGLCAPNAGGGQRAIIVAVRNRAL